MSEEWRTAHDWPEYEVSNEGKVRRAQSGRILKNTRHHSRGYLIVCLRRPGFKQKLLVHRLVAIAFLGSSPTPKHQVAHWDGNPENNNRVNLRWATAKQNIDDRTRHGRTSRGSRSGTAKITEQDVLVIRGHLKDGLLQREIAELFGVTQANISEIARRKTWSHVE